jgi:hypothetical protein
MRCMTNELRFDSCQRHETFLLFKASRLIVRPTQSVIHGQSCPCTRHRGSQDSGCVAPRPAYPFYKRLGRPDSRSGGFGKVIRLSLIQWVLGAKQTGC